ncbi:hypothetical protein D9M70_428520 [compost metagenome]
MYTEPFGSATDQVFKRTQCTVDDTCRIDVPVEHTEPCLTSSSCDVVDGAGDTWFFSRVVKRLGLCTGKINTQRQEIRTHAPLGGERFAQSVEEPVVNATHSFQSTVLNDARLTSLRIGGRFYLTEQFAVSPSLHVIFVR